MMLLFPRLWSATTMLLPLLLTMSVTLTQAFQRPRTALRISERPFVRAGSTLSMSLDSNPQIVSIEYCTGCRWMLKSMWLAQELLMTFEQDLDAVIITPSDSKGIFEVCINNNKLWDRKERGGFPSPKELKQIVRDAIDPSIYLGHSDTEQRKAEQDNRSVTRDDTNIIFELSPLSSTPKPWSVLDVSSTPRPTVTIYYCTGCRWLLRAAYFGQELLTTFTEELKSVSLVPSKPPEKGGRFVSLNAKFPSSFHF